MKIEDLITVGSLGRSLTENGLFKYKPKQDLPQKSKSIKEVFLIFKDHRVRFVDVEFSENHQSIRIMDKEIVPDIIDAKGVKVALSPKEMDTLRIEEGFLPSGDLKVEFKGEIIGELADVFDNKAHEIMVVNLLNGKEIMIPYVDYFVAESDEDKVVVRNIEGLLEI